MIQQKHHQIFSISRTKGTLVVGITEFAPMDYRENQDSEEWIGFDADMAKAFADSLGVDVEFKVINWDYKITELDNKGIDCVWNGMTLNDEVKARYVSIKRILQQRSGCSC